ncbi:MAG: hypothetical protein WD449_02555, partial [Candidatus Babeliales bacterium]
AKNRHGLSVPLGDIHGPWNVVGLLYGAVPCDQSRGEILDRAYKQAKFCGNEAFCVSITDPATSQTRFMHNPQFADPGQRFGFISAPLKYRKVGLRFEGSGMLSQDLGITVKVGVADISQTLQGNLCTQPFGCDDFCCTQTRLCANTAATIIAPGFIDLTPLSKVRPSITTDGCTTTTSTPCTTSLYDKEDQTTVERYLMTKLNDIFLEIGLNPCDFHDTSIEDAQFSLFWRHPYVVNKNNKAGYSEYTFTPFALFEASIGIGKEKDPALLFSLPFGNNGHHALGFTGGFDIDFTESISLGLEAGITKFFAKDFCDVHVPTNDFQQVLYPYTTDIRVEPGNNWHFMATFDALDFVDRLSFYAAYIFVNHDEDTICIQGLNKGLNTTVTSCSVSSCAFAQEEIEPIFKPQRLAKDTCFNAQMINGALNYAISPYSSLGFLWQIPVSQRQAYRSSTILFTYQATF